MRGAPSSSRRAITGTAAAVANAVFNATGVRVRDLPITLDKLLHGSRDQVTPTPARASR
jgi:xanthine dehydrogenase YagR molybdenum-binding subunit